MAAIDENTIREMVDAIVREIEPEQVYLFGPRARGEAREGSDIDLLVVEREGFGAQRSRLKETNRIYKAISPFRIPIDILLYSTEEFSKWKDSINHVIGRCQKEGRLLYARP